MMTKHDRSGTQRGVTLIEVMMSMGFLSIALMGAAFTMTTGVASVQISQEQLLAKQKAREAMETVFTARNTQNITFADIANATNGGIFVDGFQVLREPGVDGIANTADDAAAPIETVTLQTPSGPQVRSLGTFERRIALTDVLLSGGGVDPDIRRVEIQVRYSFRGALTTVTLNSMIARFS